MARDDSISRRTVMKLAGATTATAVLAGCMDGDDSVDDANGDGDVDDANGNGDGDVDDANGNGDGDENGGGETDDGNGDDSVNEYEIEAGERIVFDGQMSGWIGKEPAAIEGETNPTLVLQEGEEYEIGWNEGDGAEHNIEIRDEDDQVVADLTTRWTSEPGEDQFLEFEASEEMIVYRCEPHPMMEGDLVIEAAEVDE